MAGHGPMRADHLPHPLTGPEPPDPVPPADAHGESGCHQPDSDPDTTAMTRHHPDDLELPDDAYGDLTAGGVATPLR